MLTNSDFQLKVRPPCTVCLPLSYGFKSVAALDSNSLTILALNHHSAPTRTALQTPTKSMRGILLFNPVEVSRNQNWFSNLNSSKSGFESSSTHGARHKASERRENGVKIDVIVPSSQDLHRMAASSHFASLFRKSLQASSCRRLMVHCLLAHTRRTTGKWSLSSSAETAAH